MVCLPGGLLLTILSGPAVFGMATPGDLAFMCVPRKVCVDRRRAAWASAFTCYERMFPSPWRLIRDKGRVSVSSIVYPQAFYLIAGVCIIAHGIGAALVAFLDFTVPYRHPICVLLVALGWALLIESLRRHIAGVLVSMIWIAVASLVIAGRETMLAACVCLWPYAVFAYISHVERHRKSGKRNKSSG